MTTERGQQMTPDIRPLVAGNWKMNGTRENLSELKAIAEGLEAELADAIDALICPPATLIYVATAVADGTRFRLAHRTATTRRAAPIRAISRPR
jgi:triosephosphate isomerase